MAYDWIRKTLTSYKATRNLLMDIPAIDKAIFLIDRKDLDTQTTMAFQAYAIMIWWMLMRPIM
ncbi:MAG: hypothetical protein V8Q58_01200 [Anaerobutyricum hallii]|uniref:hypothetical protein n=1 Tax=Anaerobutyricum hallii TaxID=39488 RepID=UPI00300EB4F4